MPNQRAPGQKLITFVMRQVDRDLVRRALPRIGYSELSRFIRDAIKEKLIRMNIPIPGDFGLAPMRGAKPPARGDVPFPVVRLGPGERSYGLNEKAR